MIQRQRQKGRSSTFYTQKAAAPCSRSSAKLNSVLEKPFGERPTALVHFCLFSSQDFAPGLIENLLSVSQCDRKYKCLFRNVFLKALILYKSGRIKTMLSFRRIRTPALCLLELNLGVQLLGIQRLQLRETWRRVARSERNRTRQGTIIVNYKTEFVFQPKSGRTFLSIFIWNDMGRIYIFKRYGCNLEVGLLEAKSR